MRCPHKANLKVKLAIIEKTRFFTIQGTYIHVLLQHMCRIYMSCFILLKGIYFALTYSAQRWNAYGAGHLFKNIKNGPNEACLLQKTLN